MNLRLLALFLASLGVASATEHASPFAGATASAHEPAPTSENVEAPASATPAAETHNASPASTPSTAEAQNAAPAPSPPIPSPQPEVLTPGHTQPPASADTASVAPAVSAPTSGAQSSAHAPGSTSTVKPTASEEIASLLRIGQSKLEKGDYGSSEIAFRQVLTERATVEQDREALLGLARTYRKRGDFTKAAAVYERIIKDFPSDPSLPVIYLELGRTFRALSAPKQAIARFYSVINSTLKLPDAGPDEYRQLARTAQFEIAETYFQTGDYEQANRFFSRLKLLDLAPEDRARAHFKSAYALVLANDHEKAANALRSYLAQNPDDENVPEARYLLAVSLRHLGQFNESLGVALELLRAEQSRTQKDPKRWVYWQRKTGNQLANEFYERGDFGSALLIYQSLAQLSPEPSWKLPVTYQIGLCHERLQMYERARECYQTIVDNSSAPATDGNARTALADLADMAAWRLNQLSWIQSTEKQLTQIFPAEQYPSLISAPSPVAHHDDHGSAAKTPDVVR
jgi:tetratricopeptide (TPR) repeat protein